MFSQCLWKGSIYKNSYHRLIIFPYVCTYRVKVALDHVRQVPGLQSVSIHSKIYRISKDLPLPLRVTFEGVVQTVSSSVCAAVPSGGIP